MPTYRRCCGVEAEQVMWVAAARASLPLCGMQVLHTGCGELHRNCTKERQRSHHQRQLRRKEVKGNVMVMGTWEMPVTVPIGKNEKRILDAFMTEEVHVALEGGLGNLEREDWGAPTGITCHTQCGGGRLESLGMTSLPPQCLSRNSSTEGPF